MLSRINDAINLQFLRFSEWFEDLSPGGRRIFIAAMVVLLLWAARYGLIPSRRGRYSSHALIHW